MLNPLSFLANSKGTKLALTSLSVLLLSSSIAPVRSQTIVIESGDRYRSWDSGVRGTSSAIMGSPIPSPVPLPIDTYTSPSRRSYDYDGDRYYRRSWYDDDRDGDTIIIRDGRIRNSTLVNPVIIDSDIRNSTLIDPTIIDSDFDRNRYDAWGRYQGDSAIIFSSPSSSVLLEF
jgi:hypothetical protein